MSPYFTVYRAFSHLIRYLKRLCKVPGTHKRACYGPVHRREGGRHTRIHMIVMMLRDKQSQRSAALASAEGGVCRFRAICTPTACPADVTNQYQFLFNKDLNACCVARTVLGDGDASRSKIKRSLPLRGLHCGRGRLSTDSVRVREAQRCGSQE